MSLGTCSATSLAQVVTVNPSPTAVITPQSAVSFCVGDSVILDATIGATYTYQWYLNGVAIVGATTASYTANIGGIYTVDITDNGCTSTATGVTVTITTAPPALITPAGATTVCAGNSVILNANTGVGYTYQWYFNGLTLSGATNSSYTALATGSYTVEVAVGTCLSLSAAEIVTINPLPTATITPAGATTFCAGGNVSLDATTGVGYTYQWYLNGGVIAGATNATYLASATGNYTVIVTENSCSATSSAVAVTVNPIPVATITPASATTFCAGGSVVLNGSVGANYTYQWNENGNPIAGATNASFTATSTGSYTLTITALGCVATSSAVNVTVNPSPNAVFSYDANIYCLSGANPAISFPTGGTAGVFTVTPNGLNFNSATGAVTIAGSLTGTYIITNTVSASGCVSSASDTITLSNVLDATFTYGGLAFCQTGNNPSPAYPNGGLAGTFTVSPNTGLNINGTNGVINLALSTPGTYTITNTLPAGACAGAPFSLTITIAPGLNAEFTYPNNVYCLDAGTNPTVSHNNGGTDGTYSATTVSGGSIALDPNTGTINLATSTAGVYTIFNTLAANGGCAGVVSQQTITLENPADATFAYDNTAYCQNGANPVLTHPIGATDGTYSTVPNTGLSYNFATGAIDLIASVPGTYTITNDIAAGLACAASSYSQTITIDAAPSAQFEYDATNYCREGDAPVLTHSIGTDGAYSYVVVSGGPLLSMTTTNGSISLLGSDVGTYQITNIVPANGVCSADTQTRTISIVPQPDAEFFYPKELYCGAGETPIALHTTGVNGVYTYLGGTNLALNPATGEINLAASSLGTYFVTNIVQSGNICPADSSTALLIYSEQPFADLNPVGTVDLCTNGSVNLQANGGGNYNWFYGNAPLGVATNNYTTNTPGDYFVIVSNDAGCADTSAVLSVIGGSQPAAEILPAQTQICEGQSLALQATGSGNFQWLLNGNLLTGETNSTLQVGAGGIYSFVVNNACGTDTANITVNVSPGPQADFFATPNPAYTGETTVFTDQSISGALWAWDFGVNGASSILQNPSYTYTEVGTYNVTAYVEDIFGCKDTVSHPVTVIFASPDSLFIPDVFSPNGDEIYEVWNIYAMGLTDFKVSVYDRWGVKVFETISPTEKWNGTRPNGAECEAGVYYYSVTFTDNKNNKVVKKGNLTLLR